ncbi:hypothetical protein GCM10010975_10860 [Comamonas phosphati]|nr:hypothetical protein GCM10010975_10860 [Comamonas phosphati]
MKAAGMAAATGIAMIAATGVGMEEARAGVKERIKEGDVAQAMAAIATDSRGAQWRMALAALPGNALPLCGGAFSLHG